LKSVSPARFAAVNVLLAVERGRTTLAAEIERARRDLDDARDRALVIELATGTLRWRARLDALLAQCSRRPLDDVAPEVRAIVRVSAYQLDHLTRIPAHAILNDAVELTRALGTPRAAGFVNAVLRSFVRRRPTLPARPPADADAKARIAYLATTMSHPAWLVTRWLDRYGFEATERWCEFNNASPSMSVRSTGRLAVTDLIAALQAAGIDARPAPHVADAIRLPPGALGRIPRALEAEILVQDEASQIVAHSVGAQPGERVLDLCAAPGAKTLVLSQDLNGRGLLVAADYRPSRVRLLAATLERTGVRAAVVALDARRPLPFRPVFDRVFVDAPCSGVGVVSRDPDLKWARNARELPAFARAQTTILRSAAGAVRPGGTLVYATCSSEPEENERVVETFRGADERFSLARAVPGPLVRNGPAFVDDAGHLRTLPFRDALDAFFAAVLVRRKGA
jgi:16S rRNA (cytosine967-C5)-methyltransferase